MFFALIGILEQWNTGMIGLGELKHNCFRYYYPMLRYSNNPSFHVDVINWVPLRVVGFSASGR